jgi:glycosyltransferase involved in cell wall biosynthesis
VVIAWGAPELPRYVQNFRGKIAIVSHGCCDWTKNFIRGALPVATHFAAVSQIAATAFPEEIRSRVAVLPNGVELDRITPARSRAEVRAELGLAHDTLAVGYIGRFSEEKNPLAAAQAVSLIPEAVAVYIGIGWYDIQSAVEELTGGRSRFVAPPERIGDYYAALDCVVVDSPREGFGLVIAEAWLAGTPLVATPVGVIPETEVVHGALCVSVPVEPTAEQLAAAVRQAVSLANGEVVARAKQVAWREFTAAAMARRWAEFLMRVAREPSIAMLQETQNAV